MISGHFWFPRIPLIMPEPFSSLNIACFLKTSSYQLLLLHPLENTVKALKQSRKHKTGDSQEGDEQLTKKVPDSFH